ncbi:MAG: ABC transporter ATP-binding protein [Candidatus Riflebacteria bacterium]|nr:ABC transporter ATP-binding protein [Candidatus Riflebacteria bacterium]
MASLTFDRVTFSYGPQTSPILGEVSFCLRKGELVGLFGRNGSGKSTLTHLAAGLLLPTTGRVEVAGIDTTARDPEIQRRVGLLFQDADRQIVGVTVEEDLAFGPENLGMEPGEMRARVPEVAGRLGLGEYLRRPVVELSGGMRQKLALGGVLIMDPDFLILDEPTSQLDPWARRDFWEILMEMRAERDLGILVVSPQAADAERLERAMVLHGGRLVYDGGEGGLWRHPAIGEWGIRLPESVRWRTGIGGQSRADDGSGGGRREDGGPGTAGLPAGWPGAPPGAPPGRVVG